MTCPQCGARTEVVKTEPTMSGGKARLRRCSSHGRFWTRSVEKFDHWLPATAIADRGNGSATAIAVISPLEGEGGGLPLAPLSLSLVSSDQGSSNPESVVNPNRARAREDLRFGEFWELYPRRVGRKDSHRIWVTQKLDQHADLIIAAIQLQREEFLTREPDKVPHPKTWLNGERWKDEVDRNPRPRGRPAKSDGNIDELRDWLTEKQGAAR